MNLSLTTRSEGPLCSASIGGPLTLGPSLVSMSTELREVLDRARSEAVVIDVAEVSDIDSAGLGELVNIYKSATDRHIRVALTGVGARLKDMLEITHVDALLPAYETEADAVSALRQSA